MTMGEDILNRLMQRLEDHEKRISALERTPIKRPDAQNNKQSIKEFILEKKPADDVQKTLVIGYYLEYSESMASFNARDLADGFRAAKEPSPTNINDKVNSLIAKGHMMEDKEKKDKLKAWVLTNSGERFVKEELPKGE